MKPRLLSLFLVIAVGYGVIFTACGTDADNSGDGKDSKNKKSDSGADSDADADADADTDVALPSDGGQDASGDSEDDYDFGVDYVSHASIVIDGNDDFHAQAANEGWEGDGSEENPYIIEGYEIDLEEGQGGAVDVRNTDLYFVIRHCYLHGGGGAWFDDSKRGYGILTENVQNMRVERTMAKENFEGVRMTKGTTDCVLHYNDFAMNSGHGIALVSAHNNIIEYNKCINEHDDGILLGSFDMAAAGDPSNSNIIRFNWFANNSSSGICLFRGKGNFIYGNAFGAGCGVFVLNTGGVNTWYSEEERTGNWWYNFSAPDEDGDGVYDTPRTVAGGAEDIYPLVEKPDTTP